MATLDFQSFIQAMGAISAEEQLLKIEASSFHQLDVKDRKNIFSRYKHAIEGEKKKVVSMEEAVRFLNGTR